MDARASTTTVLVEKYRRAAGDTAVDPKGDYYNGLRIYALGGLHAYAVGRLRETVARDASVLDVAAGSGALSMRLADLGYRVTATDIVAEGFQPDVPFVAADFNADFSQRFHTRFDAVVALEVIEHLENPRHFLRQCFGLLRPGGVLLLSTPNLDNPVSKLYFVRHGTFQWFGPDDYQDAGHIMPIPAWVIQQSAAEAGFACAWEDSYGEPFRELRELPGRWKQRAVARLLAVLNQRPARLRGEIYLTLLRRPD